MLRLNRMIRRLSVLAMSASLLCAARATHAQLWSGVLAPSRATDWTQAGIIGGSGIPSGSWTQCGSTIAAYGSSGSPASPSTIINAITACSGTNEYVLLGPGTFYLNAAIRNVGVHNVELRGSAPSQQHSTSPTALLVRPECASITPGTVVLNFHVYR